MDYKVYLYIFTTFLCLYVFTSVDYSKFLLAKRNVEAKILVFILTFGCSYLLTNFIYDFLECCKIF